jgi:endonuclease/exonuclease/phosphatase family metal-dependent hydrolase
VRKFSAVLAAAAFAAGAWLLSERFDLQGWDHLSLTPRNAASPTNPQAAPAATVERASQTVRVASFNVQKFDEAKADQPQTLDRLAQIVRRFDVVALQEITARHNDVLPRLVEAVNAEGRKYDFVASPPLGRGSQREQYAFLFDTASLEVDRSELYVVNDPDDLLCREPLVAWFRVRGVPSQAAFTFTLATVRVEPDFATQENDVLADVFVRVQNDGRGEDDVILLGDFSAHDLNLGRLGELPHTACAISGMPTNTLGDTQWDNLLFDRRAAHEFTGRVGVFDFLREFNLTMDQALALSDHLPVWAEFSVYEGGRPVRAASNEGRIFNPSRTE